MNKRRRFKAKARRAERATQYRGILHATYPFWKAMTPEQTVAMSQKIMDDAFEALSKEILVYGKI